jgi:hypothetical protein
MLHVRLVSFSTLKRRIHFQNLVRAIGIKHEVAEVMSIDIQKKSRQIMSLGKTMLQLMMIKSTQATIIESKFRLREEQEISKIWRNFWCSNNKKNNNTVDTVDNVNNDKMISVKPLKDLKPELTVLEIAHKIAKYYEDDNIDYAIGGALAYSHHALPRTTLDVDLNCWPNNEDIVKFLGRLNNESPLSFTEGENVNSTSFSDFCKQMVEQARKNGLIRFIWYDTKIEIFLPIDDYPWLDDQNRMTRVLGLPHPDTGKKIYILSAEAIATFKLMFFRDKDKPDLERLVATCSTLDVDLVLSNIRTLKEKGQIPMFQNGGRERYWIDLCKENDKPIKN